MNEQQWLEGTFALLQMEAADTARHDADGERLDWWRSVAARVACLERLGSEMPEGVRQWVDLANAYLDHEDRQASAEWLLFPPRAEVFAAFRTAYERGSPEHQQKLAAAQDVFHGRDYYCYEEYLLDEDENSITYTGPVYEAESTAHCEIIRDIFGNPFRPVVFAPEWRSQTAVCLAKQMYESRDFSAMPILADALQDAGCENDEILKHCRDPKQDHVRGCWVVDLVLGK
jgi:hypothetical protein